MSDTSPTSDVPSSGHPDKGSWANYEPEGPGTAIGPYKILQVLGEGGFGVVYLAEQRQPVTRRVALKVIKLGMDSREVMARFEQERQALAMMDHPNVASFYEAGTTESGRPYFAMEYVGGIAINKYADQSRLTTRERLELFIPVCLAVQHAHQKGVIHRDLKPGNILVGLYDGKAVPKVIDFGIAKAVAQRLTEKTLFTEQGRMIGTPEYMSPEQAGTTGLDVDTRADVYSLGVVLYELLVGALPFDPRALREAAYDEVVRIIREQDPPRMSTKLSSLGKSLETTAQNRREAVNELRRQLSGDLDWITMRALEKDRTRRYATAQEFAADINRYLTSEPVIARPPSLAYRTAKFVRRHRFGVGTAAAISAAVILGLVGTSVGFRQALAAKADAETARDNAVAAENAERDAKVLAQSERDRARAVTQFLTDMLEEADPSSLNRRDLLMREALDGAGRRLAGAFAQQPDVGSSVRLAVARSYLGLSMYEEAERFLSDALTERSTRLGAAHADVGEVRLVRAKLLHERGKADESATEYETALSILVPAAGEKSEIVASARVGLGAARLQQRRYADAEKEFISARQTFTDLLGATNIRTARAAQNLAGAVRLQGRAPEALALYADAAQALRASGPSLTLAACLNNIGDLNREMTKFDDARAALVESLDIRQKLLLPDHPLIGESYNNLALVEQAAGDLDGAEQHMRNAVAIARRQGREGYRELDTRVLNLANVLHDKGATQEAEPLAREADELRREKYPSDHPQRGFTALLLGRVLSDSGRPAEGEPYLREAVQIWEKAFKPDDWRVAQARSALGGCLLARGNAADARALLEESYPKILAALKSEHLRTRQAAGRLAAYYEQSGDAARAEQFRRLSTDPQR